MPNITFLLEDFADKRIDIHGRLGVTSALVSLSKTESDNLRELIARVLNALCKDANLRGIVVQQGGNKALIPLTQSGTDKGNFRRSFLILRLKVS